MDSSVNFLIVLVIGEGKRKNEFAEWHNYAKYEIWGTTQPASRFHTNFMRAEVFSMLRTEYVQHHIIL